MYKLCCTNLTPTKFIFKVNQTSIFNCQKKEVQVLLIWVYFKGIIIYEITELNITYIFNKNGDLVVFSCPLNISILFTFWKI